MASSTHIAALPSSIMPDRSSKQLLLAYVQRRCEAGISQKSLALSQNLAPNYFSMLKNGEDVPLSRLRALADVLLLSREERFELIHTRLLELHGAKGEICMETVAEWAIEMNQPDPDEAVLISAWQHACAPAPDLVRGLLDRPDVAARVRALLDEIAQEEMRARIEDIENA